MLVTAQAAPSPERLACCTHVALPSLRKTQDRRSLRLASSTLAEAGFSCSVMSYWAGEALANCFMLTLADASTLVRPLDSCGRAETHAE